MSQVQVVASSFRQWLSARESAQAAFEFVLVFPLFIGLLMLLFDFGILMYQYVSVSNAAREGARYGAVRCGGTGCIPGDIQDQAVKAGGGFVKVDNACAGEPVTEADPDMICANWVDASGVARAPGTPASAGDAVIVVVRHRYGFHLLPVDFPVVACVAMRVEASGTVPLDAGGPVKC